MTYDDVVGPPTTATEVRTLAEIARRKIEDACDEQFAQADLADAYCAAAADQVTLGDIVMAHRLAERAAAINEAYAPLRDRLYVAEWPLPKGDKS